MPEFKVKDFGLIFPLLSCKIPIRSYFWDIKFLFLTNLYFFAAHFRTKLVLNIDKLMFHSMVICIKCDSERCRKGSRLNPSLNTNLQYCAPSLLIIQWVVGSAMVLSSFQCRGVILLWHMVGQGPAVLAAGAGRVGCFFCVFFFISSILSSFF